VQISGKKAKNFVIYEVAELFLSDITFDTESNLASEYSAFEAFGQSVVMNPKRRFGEPVIPSCGYTAATLAHAVDSEGSIDAAAEAYGVSKEAVSVAVRYFDYLAQAA
jgi:uncharacterized protein (DUF433 family)